MEKTIKMSLETAQMAYRLICREKNPISAASQMMAQILNENFTKEELEGKKGFTWEDSCKDGFYISAGRIYTTYGITIRDENKGVFKTEAQAKSALAFAQLSHIVAKYNDEKLATTKDGHAVVWKIQGMSDGDLKAMYFCPYSAILPIEHLVFIREEDAKLSMEVNLQLWLDYWMIGEPIKAFVV